MGKSCLVDNHNDGLYTTPNADSINDRSCQSQVKEQVWFINYDEAPDEITSAFDESAWSMGKLNCNKCSARIGAYNFVQPRRCPCGQSNLPPVWLTKSKVDVDSTNLKPRCSNLVPTNMTRETLPIITAPSPNDKYDFDQDDDLKLATEITSLQ